MTLLLLEVKSTIWLRRLCHKYKNDYPNTLFFRRTCQSTCCSGHTQSMNGFLIKYNKDTRGRYYDCYGGKCKNNIFKIGEENTDADEDVCSILENGNY